MDVSQKLEYDKVVIALGSQSSRPAVPGAEEHSMPFYR